MPRSLERTELVERQLFVRALFANFLPAEIADVSATTAAAGAIAEAVRESFHPAGTTLFREGEAARAAYFIARGEVKLVAEGETAWTFGAGDVVGIMDIMKDEPRERTAIATTDVRLLGVPGEDWLDVLEDNFEFLRGSIVSMSQRLGTTALQLSPTGGFPPSGELAPPDELRELTLLERLIALKQVTAFRGAPVDPLTNLARLVEERRLEPGEALFRIGEPAKNLFVVVNGRVDLIREEPVIRASFGPRLLVGGFSALGVSDRIFSAKAATRAQVLKIRIEDYFDLMEDHFEVGRTVLAEIARERTRLMKHIAALEASRASAPQRG